MQCVFLTLCLLVLGRQAENINATERLKNDLKFIEEISSIDKTHEAIPKPTESKTSCPVNGGVGKCVKLSECMEEQGEIDLEKLDVLREFGCQHLKICCPLDQLKNSTTGPSPLPAMRPGCGWSNPGAYLFRSQSDNHADFGEFPWIIALMKKSSEDRVWVQSDYLGGGTLIHPSVVMTVAHKVKNVIASQLKCRAGEWNTQTTNEIYPYQVRDVKKIIVHEEFSAKLFSNDVALLLLESPFYMNVPHIGIACLGQSVPQMGTECFSMGWGQDFNKKHEYAVSLKKVPLPLVAKDSCEYSLQNTGLGSKYRLHNSLICAGGKVGVDTCKGDGGSPLVCQISAPGEPVRYNVIGMVAFGIKCGTEVPGVYVNVPHVLQWITRKILEEQLTDIQFVA